MSTTATQSPTWHRKRTDESLMVECELGKSFAQVDAYRHNSASMRVRVTDERFRGMSLEERDKLVSPELEKLPEETEADIMNLLLKYPGEEMDSFRISMFDSEFEHGESGF